MITTNSLPRRRAGTFTRIRIGFKAQQTVVGLASVENNDVNMLADAVMS